MKDKCPKHRCSIDIDGLCSKCFGEQLVRNADSASKAFEFLNESVPVRRSIVDFGDGPKEIETIDQVAWRKSLAF